MFHDQSQCFQNLSARQLITSKVRFTVHETSTEITVIQLIERTLIAWKGELFQRRDLNIQTIAGIALLTPAVCQRHNNEPHRGRKLEVSLVIVSQTASGFSWWRILNCKEERKTVKTRKEKNHEKSKSFWKGQNGLVTRATCTIATQWVTTFIHTGLETSRTRSNNYQVYINIQISFWITASKTSFYYFILNCVTSW